METNNKTAQITGRFDIGFTAHTTLITSVASSEDALLKAGNFINIPLTSIIPGNTEKANFLDMNGVTGTVATYRTHKVFKIDYTIFTKREAGFWNYSLN